MLISLVLFFAHGALAVTSDVNLFSPSNGRNVSFRIYLPPDYSISTRRYPVVYDLHGISGSPQNRSNQVIPTLDAAILAGTVTPMIYVFFNGQTNSFYGDAFDGHKQVYSHSIGEVLPYVDSNYRTIANRQYRAIDGFSMGGFGAAMYAAKHPELFSAVVEYGGALSRWQDLVNFNNAVAQEMYNQVESNFLPYSLWDLTTQNAQAIRTQINYKMIVGDEDPTQASNARFRDHLLSLGIDPHYQILPGVDHDGAAYYSEGSGMRFLSNHFTSIPEPSGIAIVGILFGLSVRFRGSATAPSRWYLPRHPTPAQRR